MFPPEDEISIVNRHKHLNEEVLETLEILQEAVDDVAILVSLKAERRADSPPFLTVGNNRKSKIDLERVLECISLEGLGDMDTMAQIDAEINDHNNARLQFFVFFNMLEGKNKYMKIVQLPNMKVIKTGLTTKEVEMIAFIMAEKPHKAFQSLFPYIDLEMMQRITDKLQMAENEIPDKIRSRIF